MYPVSQDFQTAIKSTDRPIWDASIVIESGTGSLTLGMDDIQEGSLKLTEDALPGDTFAIGGAVIAQLDFIIKNTDGRFSDFQFYGGVVTAQVALMVDGAFEWVPLGDFNITDVSQPTSTITIGAKNNLCQFDVPFNGVSVTYPITNLELLSAVCSYCGVPLRSTSFLNSDYVVKSAPESACSCRDIVSDIAELAAGFARCARDSGGLEIVSFKNVEHVMPEADIDGGNFTDYTSGDDLDGGNFSWYLGKLIDGGVFKETSTDIQLGPDNRQDFAITNDPVTITGVMFETSSTPYLVGSDFYAIDISQNALVADEDIPDVLQSIAAVMIGFTYLPYASNWQGNPAVEPGDTVEQTTRDGSVYRTAIFASTYVFRGTCNLTAAGATQGAQAYQTQSKRMAQLIRNIHTKQVQLDSLQQAILNATNLIASALGGYVVQGTGQYEGNLFIADNQDITKAMKVWRWNLGGFGYSSTGIDGPYSTAITADGSIVANVLTAQIITGAMIKAGTITGGNIAANSISGDKIIAGEVAAGELTSQDGQTEFTGMVGTVNGTLRALQLIHNYVDWFFQCYAASNNIAVLKGRGGIGAGFSSDPGNSNFPWRFFADATQSLLHWESADGSHNAGIQVTAGSDGKGTVFPYKDGYGYASGDLPVYWKDGSVAYTIHVENGYIKGVS